MEQTHSIEFSNMSGDDVLIGLWQDEPADQKYLPVESISPIRWSLSRYGIGGLNQEMAMVLADEDDVIADILRAKRNNVQVRVSINGDIIFLGYADYSQLSYLPFMDGKKRLSVTLYSPINLKSNLGMNQADEIIPFEQGAEPGNQPAQNAFRVHQLLRSMMGEYPGNVKYSYRWRQWEDVSETGVNSPGEPLQFGNNCYVMFNQLWINRRTWGELWQDDTPFAQICNDIARAYIFRYGWSITHQQPLVVNFDLGRPIEDISLALSQYIAVDLLPDVIGAFQSHANETEFTNAQMGNFASTGMVYSIPQLDENNIDRRVQEPSFRKQEPYSRVVISSGNNDHTETNPESDILSDSFSLSSPIDHALNAEEFDEEGATGIMADRRNVTPTPDPDVRMLAPVLYGDPWRGGIDISLAPVRQSYLYESAGQDLEHITADQLAAETIMTTRKTASRNFVFRYRGILDPMLNYKYDGSIWCMWQGEYDVIRGTTNVTESSEMFSDTL